MPLHLPTGPLKTRYGLEPVPRCEPSTYQPISRCHNHCAIGPVNAAVAVTEFIAVDIATDWRCSQ